MRIMLNGTWVHRSAVCSAWEIVASMGLEKSKFAVEINGEIVPRSQLQQHRLQEGDVLEIVHAVGGG